MEATIQTIDKLAGDLQQLLPMKPEHQQRLDKKIRLELNYNSNHIEGNTLTYGETELLLIFDKTTGNHELREYEEMKAHDVAFEMIKDFAKDAERPLSETMIKNLHEVLLVRPFWKDAITSDGQPTRRLIEVGNYKKFPNSVRLQNGEIFHYASVEETPIQMGELMQWYREEEQKKELHPVVLAALLHYKFVRIHPFDDGNGRLSRLLMNYVLLKHNLPVVIIKSTDKKNYLFALNQADSGDLTAFVRYIAEQLIWSLELNISAANGEGIEELGDVEKEISLWKRRLENEVIVQQKTDDQVAELFIKCLNGLLNNYSEKMRKNFYDLFAKWEEKGYVNNGSSNNGGIDYIISMVNRMIDLFVKKQKDNFFGIDDYTINSAAIKIDMYGFKKDGKNTFNVFTDLAVEFQDFKYIVKFNQQPKIEKLYSEILTAEESSIIINDAIKETFAAIKENMTNPPLSKL